MKVLSAKTIGDQPVLGSDGKPVECKGGRDGLLFPSDHLGVVVQMEFSRLVV